MLAINKKCKICQTVKANKPLLKRLYDSSFYVPGSKDTPLEISRDTGMHYRGLLNHLKKHQFIDSADYQEAMLKTADKQAQTMAIQKAVKGQAAVQSIIDIGAQKLADGEITVNTDQLIRASQIQIASDEKKKDQDLMAVSLAYFMSGESKNERIHKDHEPNLIEADTSPAPADY